MCSVVIRSWDNDNLNFKANSIFLGDNSNAAISPFLNNGVQ